MKRGPSARLVGGDDLAVVAGQLRRRPHPMSRVVRRCPYGFPAVVEDLPYDGRGRPFPTLYYCTCPTLVAAVGALESGGGVRLFGERARREPESAVSLAAAVRATRLRRRELVRRYALPLADDGASLRTGVGGVSDPTRITCLHAHAAHALTHPAYVLGREILTAAGGLWCEDRRCSALLPGRAAG